MGLRENMHYWKKSLENPEPVGDDYYIFDEIIIKDDELIKKIERLRELIISFCVIYENNRESAERILDEMYNIIISIEKIQYTEFIAFWKALDISYSVFMELQNQKYILTEILKEYCKRRRKVYDRLGYSNITVQALYDSGSSRKKGTAGIAKVLDLAIKILGINKAEHFESIEEINSKNRGYFCPDKGDKLLFKEFCDDFEVEYKFGQLHQGKRPDIIIKLQNHFFIIEAKHIKESGGAQDKQIVEAIEFIKNSEKSNLIHYISFMDGIYFNQFIWVQYEKSNKISKQKRDIETYLQENKNNYFVNTVGLKELFKDLRDGWDLL